MLQSVGRGITAIPVHVASSHVQVYMRRLLRCTTSFLPAVRLPVGDGALTETVVGVETRDPKVGTRSVAFAFEAARGKGLSLTTLHEVCEKTSPPRACVRACSLCVFSQAAVEAAFADGLNLVEVEFPPLQQDYLEDSGSSAYDVSSANVRLAARFAQSFAADGKVRLFVSWGLGFAWLGSVWLSFGAWLECR